MTHRYHGPEESELILKDDCERCAEHAEHPWQSVDRDRLSMLIVMALAWEYGTGRVNRALGYEEDFQLPTPQSANERAACQNILNVLNPAAAMLGGHRIPEYVVAQMREGEVL